MSVYYYTIIAVFVLSTFALMTYKPADENGIQPKNHLTTFWLICAAVVLICVSGLRYYVGTDYGGYYRIFETSLKSIKDSVINLDEPGFPVLAFLLSRFTVEGAVFIFFTAAFTMGSILIMTYKNTEAYIFSTLLIVFTGVWHGSFNGVRQYFAAAVICLGHRYIMDKKFWKYMIFVAIAYMFHKSAIIMVIPYFILRNKITFKSIFFLTLGSILLLYNYEFIFSFIGELKDETIDVTNSYVSGQVNILRVIANVVPAIFCLFLHSGVEKDKETTFYLNILVTYALLNLVGMNSPYISRVNIYLGALVPLAMGKLVVVEDKYVELLAKVVIVGLYAYFWYYEIINSVSLNNFQWIWQR